MKLSVEFPSVAYREGPTAVAALACAIERIGYDHIDIFDHVVMGVPIEGRERGPYNPRMPILEALMALAYLAAVTTRVTLGTEVLVLPQRQPAHAAERGFREPADPDRQAAALRRLRLHRHRHRRVVRARQVDLGVGPVRSQEPDRLVHPRPAVAERLAERLVLRLLPAHPDPEPHPPARERVERAHLLGHQGRLPLRQDQHLGAERHPRGDRGHVGERHQGLEDRHLRVVGAALAPRDRHAHHHVIEDVDVVVADALDRAGQRGDRGRALPVGHARELDGQLHADALMTVSSGQARLRYHEVLGGFRPVLRCGAWAGECY